MERLNNLLPSCNFDQQPCIRHSVCQTPCVRVDNSLISVIRRKEIIV